MAYPDTVDVKDAGGVSRTVAAVAAKGRQAETGSIPIALDSEAFAELSGATTELGNANTTLSAIQTAVEANVTELPHLAADATSDMATVHVTRSTSGETSAVSATASQTTRVHRATIMVAGAVTVSLLDGPGGTVLRKWAFPAAGGIVLDFDPRPYAITTANTALYVSTSAAVAVDVTLDYIKDAG